MATNDNRFIARTEAISGFLRASSSLYASCDVRAQTGISLCAVQKYKKSKIIAAVNLGLHSYGVKKRSAATECVNAVAR